MERNANDNLNTQSGSTGAGGAGSLGGSTGGYGGSTGSTGSAGYGAGGFGTGATTTPGAGTGSEGGRMDQVKERAADLKNRAGELKTSLADKLEAGANRLRGQQGGELAGGLGQGGSGSMQQSGSQATNRLAGGMQTTADWLREHEMSDLQGSIEQQVRDRPGRTLLIALGVGYLLGKAFRR